MARICMIVYTDYPADTRVGRAAEAFVERGDDVDVICPLTPSLRGRQEISGVALRFAGKFRYGDVSDQLRYVRRYLQFFMAASIRAMRLHWTKRYDVIHVHTMPDFLVFAALGPRLLGAKVILDVRDLMPELYASKFELPESHWFVRMLKLVERASVRFTDAAVAVHQPHLGRLIAHRNPPEKFIVVMNLPDPKMFHRCDDRPASERFTLIYHGMVGTRNGLEVPVRAAALARDRTPGLRLRIMGTATTSRGSGR